MDEWKQRESGEIENCEGGNPMRLPMNYKENLSLTFFNHFLFRHDFPHRN